MKKILVILLCLGLVANFAFAEPDWIDQKIQVIGEGFINSERYPESRAKLMAKRAAVIDGRRNLLEEVLNLKLDSETSIKDVVSETDIIDASQSSLVQTYEILDIEYSADGICTATLELRLRDVYGYLRANNL